MQIFVIALLMRSVLRRQFSVFQWEALFLLVAGITVNQLSSCENSKYADSLSPAAVLYTLGSITIPSLASVYNEFALKKNMETSVLLQNFFLYFYGACFNVLGVMILSMFGGIDVIHKGLFAGFTTVTFALIVNNAFQGILSSFFFKFADTILKKVLVHNCHNSDRVDECSSFWPPIDAQLCYWCLNRLHLHASLLQSRYVSDLINIYWYLYQLVVSGSYSVLCRRHQGATRHH